MKPYRGKHTNIDWSKRDAVIAEELGCRRQYVNALRKRLGVPQLPDIWGDRIVEHQPETHKLIRCYKGELVMVSNEDFPLVSKKRWHVNKAGYAVAWNGPKLAPMHQHILGKHLDHKDGNPLNNQRDNLRPATQMQNMRNRKKSTKKKYSSKYKGVHLMAGRYIAASIYVEKKSKHLGFFKTEEEAARAYDVAARKHFGEFASLNFPIDE